MRVEYPISIPLVARLLSVVLTCSVGGGDQAGDWMIGAERRCIDEYALAVKGGRMHTGCMLRCEKGFSPSLISWDSRGAFLHYYII